MARNSPGFSQALVSLQYGDYRRFALSLLLTSLGAQMVQLAVFWQVYELTGSALLLGLTGLARAAPHVVLSLAGGVIADRVNRVRLIQGGQIANAILIVGLAGLTIAGVVEAWHLYVVTFLNSALSAVTQPARTAIIPRLVPESHLVNAVALNATISQISQIIGPALAGVAIAVLGIGAAYVINGGLYLAAMLAIIGIRAVTRAAPSTATPWRSFVEGMQFVRQKPVIISLLAIDVAETMFGSYRALLPLITANLGAGPAGFGMLSAAPGVGALLAAIVMLSLGDMRYKGLYAVYGVLAYCVALVMLALSPWFSVALLAAALLGATNTVQMIPRNSAILMISPDALRGRVEAFRTMLAGGGPSIGYTTSGALAAMLGAPLALTLGAFACAAVVVGLAVGHRELRERDLGAPAEEPRAERT